MGALHNNFEAGFDQAFNIGESMVSIKDISFIETILRYDIFQGEITKNILGKEFTIGEFIEKKLFKNQELLNSFHEKYCAQEFDIDELRYVLSAFLVKYKKIEVIIKLEKIITKDVFSNEKTRSINGEKYTIVSFINDRLLENQALLSQFYQVWGIDLNIDMLEFRDALIEISENQLTKQKNTVEEVKLSLKSIISGEESPKSKLEDMGFNLERINILLSLLLRKKLQTSEPNYYIVYGILKNIDPEELKKLKKYLDYRKGIYSDDKMFNRSVTDFMTHFQEVLIAYNKKRPSTHA